MGDIAHAKPMPDNATITLPFKTVLEWWMASDPSPLTAEQDEAIVQVLNLQAEALGYTDWVDAYHEGGTVDRAEAAVVSAEGLDGATFRGSPFDVAFWLFEHYGEHADAQGISGPRSLCEETWHNVDILLTPQAAT